jgi:signal transduction histidine kinase
MEPGGPRRAWAFDAALVAAFEVIVVVREVTPPGVPGSMWWTLPLFSAGVLTLLWRRTRPAVAAISIFSAYAGHAVITDRAVEGVFVLLPGLVALYSLGASATGRRLAAAFPVVVVLNAIHDLRDPAIDLGHEASVWSYLFFLAVATATSLVGVLVGSRRRASAERRELEEVEHRRAEAVADERAKIARELHDVVTHNVNVVVMQAMAANGVLDSEPGRVRAPLEAIESSGREALAEMRRMLGVLREETEPMLAPQPTGADLRRLVDHLRETGQSIELVEDGGLDQLPDGLGLAVYRIVQESLTNAMKHARGGPVRVTVRRTLQQLSVEVVNGAGLDEPEPSGAGQGLVGMRERAAIFGGSVVTSELPSGGYRVEAVLPLDPA